MPEVFSDSQIAELASRRLWRPLLASRLVDEASASFAVGPEEIETAWASFCKRHRIDPANPAPAVPAEYVGCPWERLKPIVERELRAAKWKEAVFGPEAKAHFDRRKPMLDRVVYSLLRGRDAGLARELWFRIKEGEATFADLAPDYAGGNEVYTGGIVGPVAFGAMHPSLAEVLRSARAGELLKPLAVADWFLVARVEHHLPVEFDDGMKRQMIEELTSQWLEQRTHGRPTD